MSASLALTRDSLISALTPAPEKTLGNVFEAKHAWRLEHLIGAKLSMPVSEAKARLGRQIEREVMKRQAKHWSFDANRLLALQLFASALED